MEGMQSKLHCNVNFNGSIEETETAGLKQEPKQNFLLANKRVKRINHSFRYTFEYTRREIEIKILKSQIKHYTINL